MVLEYIIDTGVEILKLEVAIIKPIGSFCIQRGPLCMRWDYIS
jgi:hypothetical protein